MAQEKEKKVKNTQRRGSKMENADGQSVAVSVAETSESSGVFSIAPQSLTISSQNNGTTSICVDNNVVPAAQAQPNAPSGTQAKGTPPPASTVPPKRGDQYKRPPAMIGPEVGPDPSNSVCSVAFEEVPTQLAVDGIHFDFAFGFRVQIPPNAPSNYDVRFFDMDSGMMLEKFLLKPGDFLVGDRKYFVAYRMEIRKNDQLVFVHNYDCAGKKVHVLIPDGGLGDNLAWVPMAELFQKKYRADVCCVCGEWMIRLVSDLYPGLNFMPLAGKPKLSAAYANYYCGIFEKDMKNWRPIDHQFLGMQGAVESILNLPQQPVKCRLHLGSKRPFPERYVCISTLGTNPGKCWNYPDGWNIIIRKLRSYGYRVFDLDRDAKVYYGKDIYSIPSEAEDFTGRFSIQERANLLEHADFFIGLPSGLSWLAWNTNIPVLMIVGFTMPISEFPTPYRVTNFLFCHGCWNDTNCFFDKYVPVWCPKHSGTPREIECTKVITPKMVWETICKIPQFQEQRLRMEMAAEAQQARVQNGN